jgi:mannitol-1-phosphate 5-dehydrogenase
MILDKVLTQNSPQFRHSILEKIEGNNKIVIFGAGKIGRSFIGQLFSRGGYEVVFIDVYKLVIDELNLRRNYNVIIKSEKEEVLNIKNVRGVYGGDVQWVIDEVASADLLAVSIGQNGLAHAFPLIAKGLLLRRQQLKNVALDIIIAENLRNAADYFKEALKPLLPNDYPFDDLVGLVETSIGKMVPIMLKKDMEADVLQVFAEPYNNLILDKNGFKNPIPVIEGLSPKENMKAWVDRKLFIHNLGHAATAYIGYLHNSELVFLYEALENPTLKNVVRETMLQAADILLKKYPDEFSMESLTEHIDDLIFRFQNKALGDTIYRVGCDLHRKLSAHDRLAGAIHLAIELELPYHLILNALVFGSHFRATDESGKRLSDDIEFEEKYQNDIQSMLTNVCGFDKIANNELFRNAIITDNFIPKRIHIKQTQL